MDVDALRKELEEHLGKNPDENAPSGFRDRFESVLEQMRADDGVPDEAWNAQLQRIRDEAEAAAKCASDDQGGTRGTRGKDVPTEEAGGGASTPAQDQASASFLQRFGLPLGVAAIALAAAYFALRS